MSKWSKEDKIVYAKSEVFQELEKLTIDNIYRLNLLSKKAVQMSPQTIRDLGTAAQQALPAVSALGKALKGNATDDQASDNETDDASDQSIMSGYGKEIVELEDDINDSMISDAVIDELMAMKEAAIKEGNIKLAYKIERTLDEILSVEMP